MIYSTDQIKSYKAFQYFLSKKNANLSLVNISSKNIQNNKKANIAAMKTIRQRQAKRKNGKQRACDSKFRAEKPKKVTQRQLLSQYLSKNILKTGKRFS